MNNKISEQEILEFRNHMKGVKRLCQDKMLLTSNHLLPAHKINSKRNSKHLHLEQDYQLESSNEPTNPVTAEEILSFARTGLQTKILRKLKKGQFHIAAELDLHGLTTHQAFSACRTFIHYCQNNQYRCVRIIHGKGQRQTSTAPILKNKINNWLREMPEILAFHSATRSDGGAGAIYVLLKMQG